MAIEITTIQSNTSVRTRQHGVAVSVCVLRAVVSLDSANSVNQLRHFSFSPFCNFCDTLKFR